MIAMETVQLLSCSADFPPNWIGKYRTAVAVDDDIYAIPASGLQVLHINTRTSAVKYMGLCLPPLVFVDPITGIPTQRPEAYVEMGDCACGPPVRFQAAVAKGKDIIGVPCDEPAILRVDTSSGGVQLSSMAPMPFGPRYLAAVCAGDYVFGLPMTAPQVCRIDPKTGMGELVGPKGLTGSYTTACVVNGFVYMIPGSASNVLRINVTTGMGQAIPPEMGGEMELFKSAAVVDNIIYAIPFSARKVLRINGLTGVAQVHGPVVPGDMRYETSVVVNNVVYAIPFDAKQVMCIDHNVDGGKVKFIGPEMPGSAKYRVAHVVGTNIYAIPFNAKRVLRISTDTGEVQLIGAPVGTGDAAYDAAAVVEDRIYAVPFSASRALRINTKTDEVSLIGPELDESVHGFCKFSAAIVVKQDVYGIPFDASKVMRISVRTDKKAAETAEEQKAEGKDKEKEEKQSAATCGKSPGANGKAVAKVGGGQKAEGVPESVPGRASASAASNATLTASASVVEERSPKEAAAADSIAKKGKKKKKARTATSPQPASSTASTTATTTTTTTTRVQPDEDQDHDHEEADAADPAAGHSESELFGLLPHSSSVRHAIGIFNAPIYLPIKDYARLAKGMTIASCRKCFLEEAVAAFPDMGKWVQWYADEASKIATDRLQGGLGKSLEPQHVWALAAYGLDVRMAGGAIKENFHVRLKCALQNRDMDVLEKLENYLCFFMDALHRLPALKREQPIFRGVNRNALFAVREYYEEGCHICWPGLVSASLNEGVARHFAMEEGPGGVLFRIRARSAKVICHLSSIPCEAEALLAPNFAGLVKSVTQEGKLNIVEIVEEENRPQPAGAAGSSDTYQF